MKELDAIKIGLGKHYKGVMPTKVPKKDILHQADYFSKWFQRKLDSLIGRVIL
jgi:hypothetical protein